MGMRPRDPRRRAIVAAAFVAAAAVLALMFYVSLSKVQEVAQPLPGSATGLRRQAFMDCGSQRWVACEEALDRARELDPAGESMPLVREARRRIDMAKHDGYTALPLVPQSDADMMP
jgi:hypothetical protein